MFLVHANIEDLKSDMADEWKEKKEKVKSVKQKNQPYVITLCVFCFNMLGFMLISRKYPCSYMSLLNFSPLKKTLIYTQCQG